MSELHGCLVVVQSTIDTTHHSLIITEEEDGETSNTIDGDEKTTLLKFVDHIGPGNDIHGGDYPECLVLLKVGISQSAEKNEAFSACATLEKQSSE